MKEFLFSYFGKMIQTFIHLALISPILSHIAIQLTSERDYIVIIEYGQYYSEKSKIKNTGIFASCQLVHIHLKILDLNLINLLIIILIKME